MVSYVHIPKTFKWNIPAHSFLLGTGEVRQALDELSVTLTQLNNHQARVLDPRDAVFVFAFEMQDLYLPDVNKTQDRTPLWSLGCSRASHRCTATCRARSRAGCTEWGTNIFIWYLSNICYLSKNVGRKVGRSSINPIAFPYLSNRYPIFIHYGAKSSTK